MLAENDSPGVEQWPITLERAAQKLHWQNLRAAAAAATSATGAAQGSQASPALAAVGYQAAAPGSVEVAL
jgi:hypothetical protein